MPIINANSAATTALRYTNINTQLQNKYLAQLSSGSRVQKSSDDAASLAIGSKLKSDAASLAQASINASNATGLLNTADGGLAQIGDIMQRLKVLTTQAQSGTNDNGSLSNINKEFQDLLAEVNSIATSTRFNGVSLLDGNGSTTGSTYAGTFLLGTSSTDTVITSISNVGTGGTNGLSSISALSVTSVTSASAAAIAIDTAISTVSGARAQVGADLARVDYRQKVVNVAQENASAGASTLLDADVAGVQTAYTSVDVLTQTGIAALQKANQIPQALLALLKA